jgi:SAM-dependent methyltransferase
MLIDFKTFSVQPALPAGLDNWILVQAPVAALRAVILRGAPANAQRCPIPLDQTPHYYFLTTGDSEPYQAYLRRYGVHVGCGREHSVEKFSSLLRGFHYLKPPHEREYIVVVAANDNGQVVYPILDGVHRAAILAARKEQVVPIVIVNVSQAKNLRLRCFVDSFRNQFLEWYTPVMFDDQTIIHERTFPQFIERPEYLTNRERGMSRWQYIIGPSLPDVRGKVVYDMGCNVGLYSIQLARAGAAQVVGMDRNEQMIQPTNTRLPRQNVVQQAWFVKKAFEIREGQAIDHVEFLEQDIAQFDFSALDADMLFSTCVLYHFGPRFPGMIKALPRRVKTVLLQTNLGHQGPLEIWTSLDTHEHVLREAGFTRVIRYDPKDYKYPVIVAERD